LPNLAGYLETTYAEANRLVALQNEQADEYQRWSRKGDAYVAVLALLAVALFLFGLAQAANIRTRRTFTIFGTIVLAVSLVWAIMILAG
jgi:drug/metabolite transporter superfamily protein YnfA